MKNDINLAVDSAQAAGVPLWLTTEAARIFAAASATGLGGADFSAATQFLAEMAGVRSLTHDQQTQA
jgi:3-hydroxyisobutyrate dehydrogenase-like beta-hydroxyacid dehydrogenase